MNSSRNIKTARVFFLLILAVFLFSCSSQPKPRQAPTTLSITKVANSKPRVIAFNRTAMDKTKPQYAAHIERLLQIYGEAGKKRIQGWLYTINDYRRRSDVEKLHIANRFINRLAFVDDIKHWRKKDYWASPMETLASQGGDCEDFAIAKYYTLVKMGLAQQCLTIAYVRVRDYPKPHMVLSYHCLDEADPLVLDNLNPNIVPASQRDDLKWVYSFNQQGVWLSSGASKQKKLSKISRLRMWDNLRRKVALENLSF